MGRHASLINTHEQASLLRLPVRFFCIGPRSVSRGLHSPTEKQAFRVH